MATVAAIIGANILGGIGSGITEGLKNQQRRQEWNQMYDFNRDKFNFQKDFQNRSLEQQFNLNQRGQNFNLAGGLINTGMNVGSSIIGNLLSYNHAQDTLNFQRNIHNQRRQDIQNEGLPLSYLHLQGSGAFNRSIPNLPMMRTQQLGRSVSNPWGFANSGSNLRETYGPRNTAPPTYSEAMNAPNTGGRPGFDPVSGYPK